MKDCTTCKYGYEDEQMGFPMCHHPKRFSEDCVDFNMHEEKESEHLADARKISPKDLEEAAEHYASVTDPEAHGIDFIREVFIAGAEWYKEQIMKEAVEGEVFFNPYPTISLDDCKDYDFKDGDKVRIIIVKED